jgi:hypothetical protein
MPKFLASASTSAHGAATDASPLRQAALLTAQSHVPGRDALGKPKMSSWSSPLREPSPAAGSDALEPSSVMAARAELAAEPSSVMATLGAPSELPFKCSALPPDGIDASG